MDPFSFDYTVQSETTPTEKVLCMRCGVLVEEAWYREFPMPGNRAKTIRVPYLKPASHHVQVPMLTEVRGKMRILHLQMCKSCEKIEITEAMFPLIVNQCKRASIISLLWSGYPKEMIEVEEARWNDTKILKRLYGPELRMAYEGKLPKKEELNGSNI